MRKFTLIGLGAVSTLALSLGAASPASAVIAPPGSVTNQVCNAVPAGLTDMLNQIVANGTQQALLGTQFGTASTDLTLKQADLVAALVSHIATVDAGGNTAATSSVVSARASAYADSAGVWTKAFKDLQASQLAGIVVGMQQSVLSSIGAGLSC